MNVLIDRYNPDSGEKRTDCFEVPAAAHRRMTVMDVLEYISINLDPTVAYYHHSVCDHGICGRCSVCINGKTALACLTVANNEDQLHLAPATGRTVVRDLVTQLSPATC